MAQLDDIKQGQVWKTRSSQVVKLCSGMSQRDGERAATAKALVLKGEGQGSVIVVTPSALRTRTTLAAEGLGLMKAEKKAQRDAAKAAGVPLQPSKKSEAQQLEERQGVAVKDDWANPAKMPDAQLTPEQQAVEVADASLYDAAQFVPADGVSHDD